MVCNPQSQCVLRHQTTQSEVQCISRFLKRLTAKPSKNHKHSNCKFVTAEKQKKCRGYGAADENSQSQHGLAGIVCFSLYRLRVS